MHLSRCFVDCTILLPGVIGDRTVRTTYIYIVFFFFLCIPMKCSLGFDNPAENQYLGPPMNGEVHYQLIFCFFSLVS